MRIDPQHYGIDLAELAHSLQQSGALHDGDHFLNDLLFDVRDWPKQSHAEICERLLANPVAIAAALELTWGREALQLEAEPEKQFLGRFNSLALISRLAYIGLDHQPELPALQRASYFPRSSSWSGLAFLQMVLRWASRFAHYPAHNPREFRRINLQFPFALAFVEKDASGVERFVQDLSASLGILTINRDKATAEHHLSAWIRDRLGIAETAKPPQQARLDFREAGGTNNSIYVVRAIGGVDGVDIRGSIGGDMALIIDIGDREVSVSSTEYIERHVIKVINNRTPLSAEVVGDSVRLRWYDNRMDALDLGNLIHTALREEFILAIISVNLIFDPLRISSIKPSIYAYKDERRLKLEQRREEGEPLAICTACSSYAPHAFCIASADHPPCCGRTYDELSTLAQLTRGRDQSVINRGISQDKSRGSFSGSNKAAQQFSENNVSRVNLHAIRENPHPTTAIPQCIAWYRDDLDILCLVSADYSGRSPDGKTFSSLLQRVAGRQAPGYAGVSEEYVLSPRFLAHEGGLARVAWMNSSLKNRLGIRAEHIATEQDCINMSGLRDFLSTWRH